LQRRNRQHLTFLRRRASLTPPIPESSAADSAVTGRC
jgi:hypothetical protein